MTQLFTADELAKATTQEINDSINRAFQYDDYAWQKEHDIRITYPNRAEGLHKVLYQCPACRAEYRMHSEGTELYCEACGKRWELDEYNELHAKSGQTEFSHIPDWYEWSARMCAARLKREHMPSIVLCALPLCQMRTDTSTSGEGMLTHNMNGFQVSVSGSYGSFEMIKPVPTLYSCHIEYNYLGKYGDCVDLNTLEDTWYCYPHDCAFSVTKMALATEELYQHYMRTKSKE